MKTFNWEDFKSKNIAVHCETERIANDFLKEAQKMGHFSVGDNKYSYHKNNTCYTSSNCFGCWYSSVGYYKREAYEILEWSDYMKFTREDLKVGMLVETDCGLGIIMSTDQFDVIVYEKCRLGDVNFDYIEKVWGIPIDYGDALSFDANFRPLLYERSTAKEMTVEEISKALGYDVKVVKG